MGISITFSTSENQAIAQEAFLASYRMPLEPTTGQPLLTEQQLIELHVENFITDVVRRYQETVAAKSAVEALGARPTIITDSKRELVDDAKRREEQLAAEGQ